MRVLLLSVVLLGCHRDLDDDVVADTGTVAETSVEIGIEDSLVADAPMDTCECAPGEVAPVSSTCPGVLEKKTKTCTTSCTWGVETCALPKGWTAIADAPIAGRVMHSVVWTGGEMIVFGGGTSIDSGPGMKDGAIYSLAKNAWEILPTNSASTTARKYHVAVWTGTDMLVWGGADDALIRSDGFEYDALARRWEPLPASPLAARKLPGAVWIPTTKKMFIWGGADSAKAFADGALFDPSTFTWSALPAAPIVARAQPVAVWTGSEVLVWGGSAFGGGSMSDAAAFDPAKGTWRTLPSAPAKGRFFPVTGLTTDRFVVFGGNDLAVETWDGAALSLASSPSWSAIAAPSSTILAPRSWPQAWFSGDRMTLWGGAIDDASGGIKFDPNGAVLDIKTGTWSTLSATGTPLARGLATVVWTGNAALIWSGYGKPGDGIMELLKNGALYVP
jgi:hypothetical protein